MRLIGSVDNERDARRIASYLQRKGLDNTCEGVFDAASSHISYQIWIHDEDRIEEALQAFAQFSAEPLHSHFDPPPEESPQSGTLPLKQEAPYRLRKTPLTSFLIALCSLIFFLSSLQQIAMEEEGIAPHAFALTPIEFALLIDVPAPVAAFEQRLLTRGGNKLEPAEAQAEMKQMESIPFWRGAYTWTILKVTGKDISFSEGPLFSNVAQGEVWRLFSPALLHFNLLHILFNMIWLWVLGRPIEQRIGFFRTALLSLAAGVGANVVQYLMSGPFFLGYSGVIAALAGFTWMREKIAPWEGYPLNRATLLLLALFVGGMFLLEFVAFIFQVFTAIPFEPGIANSAHIGGALIGIALARFSYFSARVSA